MFVALRLLALLATGVVVAQPASPGAVAGGEFPVPTIHADDHGFSVPATVTACRYLVVLDNTSKQPVGTSILEQPNGVSVGDVQAAFASLPNIVPPRWYYQARMPGAPDVAPPGQRTRVVLDLTPGRYDVISSDPPAQPATPFDVVPSPNGRSTFAPTPRADARVVETDFAFPCLPPRVSPGQHVWQVTNASSQPHLLDLSRVPAGSTTLAQAITTLSKPATGTSAPGSMSMDNFAPAGGLMLLSPCQTGWAVLDLPPGRYLALCSVLDPATGKPHYMLGMVGLFDLGTPSSAAPGGTPAMRSLQWFARILDLPSS